MLSDADWEAKKDAWLPSESDRDYLHSIMTHAVHEPGKMANWIAPPKQGIKGNGPDFEYVRFD